MHFSITLPRTFTDYTAEVINMQTVVQIWTQQSISADRTERLKYTVPESTYQRIKKKKRSVVQQRHFEHESLQLLQQILY